MIRVVSKFTSSKNFLVYASKCKKKVFNSDFKDQIHCVSVVHLCYSQKRFNSSKASENPLHKVFFVNAESPPSNTETYIATDSIEYIPPPPVPPPSELTEEVGNVLNALGEPTFQSLGLGGWWPTGIIQSIIEFLHVSGNLPWWGSITIVTIMIRSIVFPLVLKVQRNNAVLNNNLPTVQALQNRISEAKSSGNHIEAAKAAYELQTFFKEKNINPMRSMMLPLAQAPFFMSMFIGLRQCANLPVESMKDGGLYWFSDLTIADPYYGLPIITCLTMMATIKIGTDAQPSGNAPSAKIVKYILPAIPLVIFPFTCHFPGALLWYWVSTNIISLIQVGILRIPKVRKYFNINAHIKHEKPKNSKGFVKDVKESFSNMKAVSKIEDRAKYDARRFEEAGRAPVLKTYKRNPLTEMKAKPRDA